VFFEFTVCCIWVRTGEGSRFEILDQGRREYAGPP
jgi:hypothetical protein